MLRNRPLSPALRYPRCYKLSSGKPAPTFVTSVLFAFTRAYLGWDHLVLASTLILKHGYRRRAMSLFGHQLFANWARLDVAIVSRELVSKSTF